MAKTPKRFIKKVPPSGGPPAFKLTLPHQVVHRHLLHLVDTDFDLAPSATAEQTWQGSIAPRRNKERSEYTLQGWKLFAEAHRVQAGDQVSFELVSPHRMIVQVIRPVEAASPSNSPPDLREGSPQKSAKQTETSSPGGAGPPGLCHEEDPIEWLSTAGLSDAAALDEEWQNFSEAAVQQLSAASEGESSHLDASRQLALTSPSFEAQVASVSLRSQSLGSESRLNPALKLGGHSPAYGSYNSLPSAHLGMSSALGSAMSGQPHSSPTSTLPSSQPGSGSMSTLLHELAGQTIPSGTPLSGTLSQSPILENFFADPEGEPPKEALVPKGMPPGAQLNSQLLDLTSTIQALQGDVRCFEVRADKAEVEATKLRGLFEKLQVSLDRQSREALRAANGLERTAARLGTSHLLTAVDPKTADALLEIQTDMFNCLSMLKGSLWQLLVLTIDQQPAPEWPSPSPQPRP